MLNIGILVSGGGTNLQAIIDAVGDGRITNAALKVVIADRPGAFALERASMHNIPTCVISRKEHRFENLLLQELIKSEVDLVVLAGFLSIIGKKIISQFKNSIINVHPSLIPSFCGMGFYGLKVHEKALEYGVKVTGATVHFVNEKPDAGPIIMQKAVSVREGDTPEILQKRVMEEAEHVLLPEVINMLANNRQSIN